MQAESRRVIISTQKLLEKHSRINTRSNQSQAFNKTGDEITQKRGISSIFAGQDRWDDKFHFQPALCIMTMYLLNSRGDIVYISGLSPPAQTKKKRRTEKSSWDHSDS